MSQENVEVVREILAEFATTHRGVPRLTTPDVVWDMGTFRGWPDVPEYRGTEGFNEFFAKWTGPYDDWDFDLEDLRPTDDSRVVAILTQRGRLRGTDDWVALYYGMIFTVIEGLVSRIEAFATCAEALEAAGLRE
jgi:ketosteroid isomerase-like protein